MCKYFAKYFWASTNILSSSSVVAPTDRPATGPVRGRRSVLGEEEERKTSGLGEEDEMMKIIIMIMVMIMMMVQDLSSSLSSRTSRASGPSLRGR